MPESGLEWVYFVQGVKKLSMGPFYRFRTWTSTPSNNQLFSRFISFPFGMLVVLMGSLCKVKGQV